MSWDITFISEQDFCKNIQETIDQYQKNIDGYEVDKFFANTVDPIKMMFDKMLFGYSWEYAITKEILRQKDKANNNAMGYFHQNMFRYIKNCVVPTNGTCGGWDVIVNVPKGYKMGKKTVHKLYIEMKNKYNTMNNASSRDTFKKMKKQVEADSDCGCLLVEVIAGKSKNKVWKKEIDGVEVEDARIRKMSIDRFYKLVTGDKKAFYKLYNQKLPVYMGQLLKLQPVSIGCKDLVIDQLKKSYQGKCDLADDNRMVNFFYQMSFSSYEGFEVKEKK